MAQHTPPFVDGDLSASNRVTAEWLNWVNENVGTGGGGGASTAADVSYVPSGDLSAVNVQAALDELEAEKVGANTANVAFGYAKLDAGGKVPAANLPAVASGVSSVNARTGVVTLSAADVGLSNVNNTSDLNKPISTATQTALNAKAPSAASTAEGTSFTPTSVLTAADVQHALEQVETVAVMVSTANVANGYAKLDSGGLVPTANLPVSSRQTFVVASQAAMLALSTAAVGDTAVRTDISQTFILQTADASVLAHWVEMLTPASPVTSVAGRTGAITLTSTDVGLGNVNNTSDLNKPVSTATQTELNLKAPSSAATAAGTSFTPTGTIAATDVQTAIAEVASETVQLSSANVAFGYAKLDAGGLIPTAQIPASGVSSVNTRSGAVTLSAADVGLANANNTSDANKPISTATQDALNLKVSMTSSTGQALIPTGTTGQRDAVPTLGGIRYNIPMQQWEGYSAVGWQNIGSRVLAADVLVTPHGSISSTDVQYALQELDTEKAPASAGTAVGTSSTTFDTITATNVQAAMEQLNAKIGSGGGSATAATTSFTPAGNISATNVQAGMQELDTEKAPASAATANGTSFTPAGGIGATSVQTAIQELDTEKAPASAGTATGTSFTPVGSIAATNVQTALQEVDSEKVATTTLAATSGASLVGYTQGGTGAASLTVQTKLRMDINLLDFGADPTGTTDCTTALINAIAAAKLASGVVLIPKGKFRITTGGIEVGNVELRGSGIHENSSPYDDNGSVFLLYSTTASPFVLRSGFNLQGLTFFYPGQTGATVSPVVYPALFSGTYISAGSIVECNIINAYIGLEVTGSGASIGDFLVSRCRIYCVHTVFNLLSGSPEVITLTDTIFSLGIYNAVANASPYYLRNYTATYGAVMIIDIAAGAYTTVDGLSMQGCLVFGYRYGTVVRSGGLAISKFVNNLFDATQTAFQVETAGYAVACNFTNNIFVSTNNYLTTTTAACLSFAGTGAHTNLVILNNEFSSGQGNLISMDGTSIADEVMIVGNKFKSWGINTAAVTQYYAIMLNDPEGSVEVLIANNQFKNNADQGSGIWVRTVSSALIEGNQFITCYYPITVGSAALKTRIYNNQTLATLASTPLLCSTAVPGAIEASGNSWDKVPTRYAYPMVKSVLASAQMFNSGTPTAVVAGFGTEVFDEDNNWNPATGTFTAPTAGFYNFTANLVAEASVNGDVWKLYIKSGAVQTGYTQNALSGLYCVWSLSSKFKLAAGDTVQVFVERTAGSGTLTCIADADMTWFTAEKAQ